MSFSEVRDYQYGDDVRNIDWNVTARTNQASVKVFEEERELTVLLVIDVSASALFGTRGQFKSDMITEIAAVLAFSAATNNDKVGAILFSDKIERYIPPKKGRTTILRIIRELINQSTTSTGTNLSAALEYLNNIQKKRAIVFLLSDFIADNYHAALNVSGRKHDIIGIQMHDIAERNIPDVGLLRVKDNETGEVRVVDTSSASVRKHLQEQYDAHDQQFRDAFRQSGSDTMTIRTDEDYIKSLLKFFKSRSR